MKRLPLSVAVLATMTTVAAAEPKELTDSEMAGVTAGLYDVVFIVPITIIHNTSDSAAVGIHAQGVASKAESNVTVNNVIGVDQTTYQGAAPLPASAVFAGAGWPWAESGPSAGGNSVNPLQAWPMIADMLRTRFLGRGW